MASVRSKELRLYLTPEHWEVFDRVCERQECYRGRLASQIVAAWCRERESLDRHAKMVATANEITEDMAARGPQ